MAKKAKRATPKQGKPAKAKKTNPAAKALKKTVERKRTLPRSVPLPGMEQARYTRLDALCEAISDTRAQMNQLRTDEAADERAALAEMRKPRAGKPDGILTYRHAGVELARVPGEEKLRVRTTKANATAEVTDGAAADAGDVDDAGNQEPADLGEQDLGDGSDNPEDIVE